MARESVTENSSHRHSVPVHTVIPGIHSACWCERTEGRQEYVRKLGREGEMQRRLEGKRYERNDQKRET